MLINLGEQLRKYNIETKGIIHCGAHYCEEHDDYVSYGICNFFYIEPCKEAYDKMRLRFNLFTEGCGNRYGYRQIANKYFVRNDIKDNIELINCACGSEEGQKVMYTSNNNEGQSNSLLEPNLHLQQHPEVVFDEAELVTVALLDNIVSGKYNILAMDCQGFEGEVLKGATETLKHIDCIYSEVNRGDTYRGNMLIEEMDEYLKDFTRVETYWPSPSWTWGDAVYIRKTLL